MVIVSDHEASIQFDDIEGGPSWSFGVKDGMDDALGLLKTKGVGGDGDLPSDFVLRHIDIQLGPGFHVSLLIWASRRSMKRSSSPTQSLIRSIILSRDLRCLSSL